MAWLVMTILSLACELTILLGVLFSFIPKDQTRLLLDVLPRDLNSIKVDWKILIYHLVIGIVIAVAAIAVTRFKGWCFKEGRQRDLKLLSLSSIFFFAFQLFAVFFMLILSPNQWAGQMLAGALIASALSKGLFPEWTLVFECSGVMRKVAILGILIVTALFLSMNAPAAVLGYFLLWIIGIITVITVFRMIQFNDIIKYIGNNGLIRQTIDMLVWISSHALLAQLANIGMVCLIISLLCIIDPLAVLAKTAFGEHYYHFDLMLMGGAYVNSAGNTLGVDQNVFYGLGMPIMVSGLSKLIFGSLTYLNVLNVYWWLTILYYVAFYLCLRFWLGSVLLAAAAVLLAIKWQVFYSLSYPVSPIYPNGSPLRCFWDIPVFLLLFMYLKHGKPLYLSMAAFIIGGAMVFMATTGVDLYIAFATFLTAVVFIPFLKSKKINIVSVLALMLVPIIFAFLLFWLLCGNVVFSQAFWKNLFYYPSLFTNGFYNIWFWESLLQGKYLNFLIGCIVPILYLGTFVWIAMRLYRREANKYELITLIICAYGLNLYHHYLVLSLQNNYYMRAIPFIWVIFYWVKLFLTRLESSRKQALFAWGILSVCAFMLFTNKLYQAYPNYWNTRNVRNPMVDPRTAYGLPEDGRPYFFHQEAWNTETNKLKVSSLGRTDERIFFEGQIPDHATLKNLYAQEFDFTQDGALIASLTAPKDKVALLSSFEIHLLMQAKRRPLFFFFPVVASRGMHARTFPTTNLHTKTMMNRSIEDIKHNEPEYIFLEKVMLTNELPESYSKTHEALLTILEYVKKNYHPYKEGQFLVAMKRNPS